MLFAKHITFSILVVENAKVLNCFFDVTINHFLIFLIVLELNPLESVLFLAQFLQCLALLRHEIIFYLFP